jgi:hypothetical protein
LLSCSTGSDIMPSLNGLRFISIFWILLGHTYYMKSVSPNINSIVVKHVSNIRRPCVVPSKTFFPELSFLQNDVELCTPSNERYQLTYVPYPTVTIYW